jgi:hypothetical protein
MLLIVNADVPVFVILTVCAGLIVPSAWFSKARDVELSDATAVVLVPVPFRVIARGGATSKEKAAFPFTLPATLGVKENVKLALAPTANVTGSVPPVHANAVPLTEMLVTVAGVAPRL